MAIAKIEQRLITRRGRFYKPKGMLWRTFHRLCDRYDHHNAVLNAGLARVAERPSAPPAVPGPNLSTAFAPGKFNESSLPSRVQK